MIGSLPRFSFLETGKKLAVDITGPACYNGRVIPLAAPRGPGERPVRRMGQEET